MASKGRPTYTALSGTLVARSTDRQRRTAVEGLRVVACGTFVRADNLLQLMLTDHVMELNLHHRIEQPILVQDTRRYYMRDIVTARELQSDGTFVRVEPVNAQVQLLTYPVIPLQDHPSRS